MAVSVKYDLTFGLFVDKSVDYTKVSATLAFSGRRDDSTIYHFEDYEITADHPFPSRKLALDRFYADGYTHIVALSSPEHVFKSDPDILSYFESLGGSWYQLPTDDHFDYLDDLSEFLESGRGITYEKLIDFCDHVKRIEETGQKVIAYCGYGFGRSLAYALAYRIRNLGDSFDEASAALEGWGNSHEIYDNGAYDLLQRFFLSHSF